MLRTSLPYCDDLREVVLPMILILRRTVEHDVEVDKDVEMCAALTCHPSDPPCRRCSGGCTGLGRCHAVCVGDVRDVGVERARCDQVCVQAMRIG